MERRWPPWVADGAIAASLFALSMLELGALADSGLGFTRASDPLSIVLIALQTLPLVARRRLPFTVLLVVVGAWLLHRGLDYPSATASIGMLVAVHAVGSELSPRRSATVGLGVIGLVCTYTALGAAVYPSVGYEDILGVLFSGCVALFLGREVHQRRERARTLEERVRRVEQEREDRARAAVADERARVARELHDVVAHQMAVMTVQAEGASRIARDADPRLRQALDIIREAGRAGLTEMRRMVGLLRGADGDAALDPLPGLERVRDLADHFTEGGLPVTVTVTGTPRPLSSGVDLSAYRIVQESLTNVLKHAGPGAGAAVAIAYDGDHLDLRITDDGTGVGDTAANGGHGLVGMRERAALLGGEFTAGPRPGGGFEVHASLPVSS